MPSKPVPPLEVTDIQKDSVTLQWQPPEDDGGSPITGYLVEKRDAKKTKYTIVERVGKVTNNIQVRNLMTGNEYYFSVKAENKAGLSEPLETDTAIVPKSPYGNLLYHIFSQ